MKKDPLDKWLYFLVTLMGVYFLIRIIDQAKMIHLFPVVNNDLGSYVSQLYMLKVCGFHEFCPYWYNGFINFLISSPGWQFFAYPLYLLSNNVLLVTYISSILMYIIGFIFIYYIGKSQNFSLTKRIAFFILIFGNSINIGNLILMGRMPDLNSFIFFLGSAAVVYFYKDRKIDKKFVLFFIPINVLVIISHYQVAILSQILILSLFLIKKGYEKLIIVLSFILSLIFSAFWWVPFLLSTFLGHSNITKSEQGRWVISILPKIELTTQFFTSLLIIIIPIVLFVVFYFYWISKKKSSKEILFYSPVLILGCLFLFRLTAYIPLFKHISPDHILIFFLFFVIIIFFKTNFDYYPKILKLVIILFLIIIPIANVIVSHVKTPYWSIFEYGDVEKETLSLFESIDQNEKFVFASWPLSTYAGSHPDYYYAYATVYHNLSTSSGYYHPIASHDYLKGLTSVLKEKDCGNIRNTLLAYNTTYAIAYEERCDFLKNCGFKEVTKKDYVCLYRL